MNIESLLNISFNIVFGAGFLSNNSFSSFWFKSSFDDSKFGLTIWNWLFDISSSVGLTFANSCAFSFSIQSILTMANK